MVYNVCFTCAYTCKYRCTYAYLLWTYDHKDKDDASYIITQPNLHSYIISTYISYYS